MTRMEIVRRRRSVRTFDGRGLEASDREWIEDLIKNAENPYGLDIDWKILSAKADKLKSPVIEGTDVYIAGKMKKAPHAEEAFGYSFEKIVLDTCEKGIGTTWIAGTMDRPAFERAVNLGVGEVMPCVSPLGYPAKRMGLKETLMRKGVKADVRLPFAELFFDGDFATPLSQEKDKELTEILEMIRWAPSAVNKQPWRIVIDGNRMHFYERRSKGYVSGDGWDLQKIDMGIALYHLVYAVEEKGKTAEFMICEPEIDCPVGMEYIATYRIG